MRRKVLMLLTISLFSMLGTIGCQEKKGPFEEAGEEIDEEVNDAKRKIEDATD